MSIPDRVLEHLRDVLNLPDLSATRYQVIDLIGEGGMGAVYRVRDTLLEREVALKVIDIPSLPADPLLAEASLLARLEHPGIVPVYDAGALPDGRAFYVMRHVEGVRLDEFLRGSPALAVRLKLFAKLCDAVAFAHSRGVIHRDLKPENVMTGPFGEVIVLDWGVALWTARGDPASGTVVGTSRYMAPEQARGAEVDVRADIYSLGVMLAEMLPGTRPRPLAAIAAKARSAAPAARYSSVADLAEDVRRFEDHLPVVAYSEAPWERAARFIARNRLFLLLILAYVTVRVLLFVFRSR